MMEGIHLPTLNAILNATTLVLLVSGLIGIKRRRVTIHKFLMGSAFFVSILFLSSYLTHHYLHGSTRYTGEGALRALYFVILTTHTVIAALIVPLALLTIYKAVKNRFTEHTRLARWLWPLWMYVSITGVVIYWMLYKT